MASTITLGLSQIMVGTAAPNGTMPAAGSLTKIGKTYKDTCKLTHAKSDVQEHYEEGKGTPEIRKKQKKVPVLTFSIMDPDLQFMTDYVGGEHTDATTGETPTPEKWGFDGSEEVVNRAIQVQPEQGLWVNIPNGDIDATLNADFSAKGIFLVDFEVTPLAVSAGKSIEMIKPLS